MGTWTVVEQRAGVADVDISGSLWGRLIARHLIRLYRRGARGASLAEGILDWCAEEPGVPYDRVEIDEISHTVTLRRIGVVAAMVMVGAIPTWG